MTREKKMGLPDPERSKRSKAARSKGSRAERDLAKVLGLWFFQDDQAFHRVPASGGLRWSSSVAKTRGDIVCSADENFPYTIEVKNQEKGQWDLLSILFNEGPIIKKWWSQCLDDSIAVNKLPLLIFTRNKIPFIAMLRYFDGKYFKNISPHHFKDVQNDVYITPLAFLLNENPPYVGYEHLGSNKLIQRHVVNVLKRVNAKEQTKDNSSL